MISVLIVDDSSSSRLMIRVILEESGQDLEIFEAPGASEALDIVNNSRINIILSDIEMPNMNGFEFARVLKDKVSTKHIPIIFISSHTMDEYIENTKGINGFDILQKPVNKDILIAKVQNYVNMYNIIEKKSAIINEHIIYSETDLDGCIIYASEAFLAISGYTREELLDKPHNIVRHPEMKSSVFKEMWTTIQSGNVWTGIITNLKKDGSDYTLKATVFPIYTDDIISGYASARQDITKQVQASEEFRTILDAQLSIVVISKGKKLVRANKVLYDTFGYKNYKDFMSQHDCVCDLFIDKDISHLKKMMGTQNWLEYIKEKTSEIHEAYMIDKDDNEKVYNVTYRGLLKSGEEIVILDDITEIKRQTNILFQQSRFAAMGEMIGMIAHQWRQPLSAMNALMIKLNLKRKLKQLDDETWKESYVKHNELTTYMTTTINDFKNFFKDSTEEFEVTVSEIVQKPYRLIEDLLTKQNVSFEVNYNDETLKDRAFKVSSSKLDQVFMNLYKNTLDEFISKNQRDGKIHVECTILPKSLIFSVCDNAGGIPPDIINRIFDPYFSTKADNGTGIGLYMTKLIIENHIKGKIDVYNTSNGACFMVSIPVKEI